LKKKYPNYDQMAYSQFITFEQNKCKVKGCLESHRAHYCRICKDNNSSHYSKNCPKGTSDYHNTVWQSGDIIRKKGFKPSSPIGIRKGENFIDDPNIAWQMAKDRVQKYNS